LALKNTYLKTLKHTNETINYGMIQMSGGDMVMNYDQERTFFKGHCLEYDTIDMFQMLVDIALEPRSVLAANVARSKNRKSHDLQKHLHKYDPFSENTELLLRTAYGYNTLGMPSHGLEHNIDNLDARVLQQFIMDNITPRKCLIVASGVQNHKEYVDLVKERLGDLLPVPEHLYKRTASEYIGGEYRTWTETPQTNIALAFHSTQWNHEDTAAHHVMNTLIGNSAHGKNRAYGVTKRHNFVDNVQSLNHHFSDSGLFGLTVEGAGSHSQDLLNVALEELSNLRNRVGDEELARAKNKLKMQILTGLEKQEDRLEEIAKNFLTFGDLTFHQYCDQIDRVTSEDVNRAASRTLGTKPTMVVTGGAINLVPTITDVQRQLQ
jgi:predicted Zn-dependent peptidase